jgi:diaminopimelate epimerase
MNRKIFFEKYQGIGNDFIIIDAINQRFDDLNFSQLSKRLCNRRIGIGADGLIIVAASQKTDFKMRIFNSDGSEAEMCGNGMRCLAKYVYQNKLIEKEVFSVETKAGIIVPALIIKNGQIDGIEVDMGLPKIKRKEIPMLGKPTENVINENLIVNKKTYKITGVSMGNPHAVVFVDNLQKIDLPKIGPLFEHHQAFPAGINTEFVQILNRNEAIMIVWERGAGATLACGTGACAVLVAGVLNNLLDRKALIHLPGGDLLIEWQIKDNRISLTGTATFVFRGEIDIDN